MGVVFLACTSSCRSIFYALYARVYVDIKIKGMDGHVVCATCATLDVMNVANITTVLSVRNTVENQCFESLFTVSDIISCYEVNINGRKRQV